MGEQQILIPVSVEVFWRQMKTLIKEVLADGKVIGSARGNCAPVPKLLKMKEVCELFQVSKPTVYEWMRKRQLHSIKIESRRFFLESDVEHLINKNKTQVS